MSYYVVLGISADATLEEVKQAYHRLAKMYHPDKNSSPDATSKMAQINLAYEALCDAQRRREYDLENHIGIKNEGIQDFVEHFAEEEQMVEITEPQEQEVDDDKEERRASQQHFGKCIECSFVNDSGMFICTVCGNVFDPSGNGSGKKKSSRANLYDYIEDAFDLGYEEVSAGHVKEEEDAVSEIIRCPRCNEINKYSNGSLCWQCGLQFDIEEFA